MRTIYLLKNKRSLWYVRTMASNGKHIAAEESFSSAGNGQRAFVTEGQHQPFARMVVEIEGEKAVLIRAGGRVTDFLKDQAKINLKAVQAAMRKRPTH